MTRIKSDTVVAEAAIKELTGIDSLNMSNQTLDITYSTVTSILSGNAVNSQLMNELTSLVQVVLAQANKFPEVAYSFEEHDSKIGAMLNE